MNQVNIYEGMSAEILQQFREYHRANPWIFEEFIKEAFVLKDAGRLAFGAKEIFERMRWRRIETNSLGDFKINNTWAPYYARALIKKHPEFYKMIQLKKLGGGNANDI
jgi:hypothetical protein